jgi:hypothetical protein
LSTLFARGQLTLQPLYALLKLLQGLLPFAHITRRGER